MDQVPIRVVSGKTVVSYLPFCSCGTPCHLFRHCRGEETNNEVVQFPWGRKNERKDKVGRHDSKDTVVDVVAVVAVVYDDVVDTFATLWIQYCMPCLQTEYVQEIWCVDINWEY
jgi:hypothetical protein